MTHKHNTTIVPPTLADIQRLPLADAGTYILKETDISRTRSHIYQLNQSHVHGWRWRTAKLAYMIEKVTKKGKIKLKRHPSLHTLLVWRVA